MARRYLTEKLINCRDLGGYAFKGGETAFGRVLRCGVPVDPSESDVEFLKKFGIGLPRPMLPKEIADQEGLSKARVSQIFQSVIEQIQVNSVKYDIDSDQLFASVRKMQ